VLAVPLPGAVYRGHPLSTQQHRAYRQGVGGWVHLINPFRPGRSARPSPGGPLYDLAQRAAGTLLYYMTGRRGFLYNCIPAVLASFDVLDALRAGQGRPVPGRAQPSAPLDVDLLGSLHEARSYQEAIDVMRAAGPGAIGALVTTPHNDTEHSHALLLFNDPAINPADPDGTVVIADPWAGHLADLPADPALVRFALHYDPRKHQEDSSQEDSPATDRLPAPHHPTGPINPHHDRAGTGGPRRTPTGAPSTIPASGSRSAPPAAQPPPGQAARTGTGAPPGPPGLPGLQEALAGQHGISVLDSMQIIDDWARWLPDASDPATPAHIFPGHRRGQADAYAAAARATGMLAPARRGGQLLTPRFPPGQPPEAQASWRTWAHLRASPAQRQRILGIIPRHCPLTSTRPSGPAAPTPTWPPASGPTWPPGTQPPANQSPGR
jgi:hypothetical protein